MSNCPRCHQPIDGQAIRCPHCNMLLKAHGHPGITLHYATEDVYLCDSCIYHEDDTCTFPQRPYAKTCTLYQERSPKLEVPSYQPSPLKIFQAWCRRNRGLLLLLVLIGISILIAL